MVISIFGFNRAERVVLDEELLNALNVEVPKPKWSEFESSISPVWASVISTTGHLVKNILGDVSNAELKDYYENFFINGLSDGAAVGAKMNSMSTVLKLLRREKSRLKLLESFEGKNGAGPLKAYPDFGCPWQMKYKGASVNFEMTDHLYFALFLKPIVNRISAVELIFLGDGCGYLSQALTSVIDREKVEKVTFIDLYHFLARQFLLWSYTGLDVPAAFLNGERDNYPTTQTPKILVNQDSLVEISEIQQKKYFEHMQSNNVVALCSYNKYDVSHGHHDFRSAADGLYGSPVIRVPSPMRAGYWFEIWVKNGRIDCN